jgi:uncharacterized protein DUF1573
MNVSAPLREALRRAAAPLALLLALACSREGSASPPPAAIQPASQGSPAPAAKPAAAPENEPGEPAARAIGGRDAPPAANDVFALEPATLSLGLLEPNEERQVDFQVKNLSKQPLRILTIKTGCKCVTLDYAKGPIAIGGSASVHVKVTGVTRESRSVPVKVTTDDPRRSSAELAVYYAVVPPIDLMPPKIDFGKVKVGEKAELAIKVKLHLPKEIEKDPVLEPFVAPETPIKITLDPPTVTPDGADFRDLTTTLHLVLDTGRPLPPIQAELVFKPKEAKTYRFTSIPVFGEVRSGIFFEHDKLAFVGGEVGKPALKAIRLYFTGEKAPELAEVAIDPADFTEKHELEADRHCWRFDVTSTPRAAGALNGELRVKVAGVAEPLVVALTARSK